MQTGNTEVSEQELLVLGYEALCRDQNHAKLFITLAVQGKVPWAREDLNGFSMDYEVFQLLVSMGRKFNQN